MLTVTQVAVIGCLICTTIGFILGYRAGKDIWRCKREDRCRSNDSGLLRQVQKGASK